MKGDIYAQRLHVVGSVEGRLIASHKITVHHTAHIVDTIITPCLVLEDGAIFRGNIVMDAENDVLLSAFEGSDQKTYLQSGAMAPRWLIPMPPSSRMQTYTAKKATEPLSSLQP